MECKNCGKDNGDCRKTCCVCGKILEGYTINNVTGKYGYRGGDGLFYESQELYLNKSKKESMFVADTFIFDKLIIDFGKMRLILGKEKL